VENITDDRAENVPFFAGRSTPGQKIVLDNCRFVESIVLSSISAPLLGCAVPAFAGFVQLVTGTSYGIIAPLTNGVTSIVDEGDFDAER
jgi:hypothetical protein